MFLLDEPAAGVNPALMQTLIARIEALSARGTTFVVIEHSMDFVMRHCHPILVLAEGRVVFQGSADAARADPLLLYACLGTPPMSAQVLSIEALVAGYVRDLPILHGVNLSVARDSLTVIIGPNGAGKSTLIKAVAGHVTLDGAPITGIRPDRMAALGLANVPQSDHNFRQLTLAENLALVLRVVPERARRPDKLYTLFPALREKARQRAGTLSGGGRGRCWRWRWRCRAGRG